MGGMRRPLSPLSPPSAVEGESLPQNPFRALERGVQRDEALCRGHGVSPVFGLITPFLARKGDGGMVEAVVSADPR